MQQSSELFAFWISFLMISVYPNKDVKHGKWSNNLVFGKKKCLIKCLINELFEKPNMFACTVASGATI